MKAIYWKWIYVFGSLGLLGLLYFIFEIKALTYACDKEENNSACFLLHKKLLIDQPDMAKGYLEKSCDLEYELACKKLEKQAKVKP